MVRYFAHYSADGRLLAIGVGRGGVEISAGAYAALRAQIREKAALVDALCTGSIAPRELPGEWRDELCRRAAEIPRFEGSVDKRSIL